ncbi:MAG: DUF2157 domain-containing protein [Nocardioides marinisabuli]|uniref:DUF2157 domain-containing protein n=1 Tax=Nocardioides marinisabuli TaxID=419476 RepID=UPI00321B9054
MSPTTPAGPRHQPLLRPASPARLAWLADEVQAWREAGVVDGDQAAAILAGYSPGRRFSLVRLLTGVGAAFVGIGALWLVAANLESLSPLARFVLVTLVWVAALTGGEVLQARSASPPAVAATRLVAALLVGGVVMQAAQSLQVPAWEPALVGWWSLAALVHAYAARAVPPLVVGVLAGSAYAVWAPLDAGASGLGVVLALGVVGVGALALPAPHERVGLPVFARVWRESGLVLVLASLVVAAVPWTTAGERPATSALVLLLGVGSALVVLGLLVGGPGDRVEVLGALAALGTALVLVAWEAGADAEVVTGPDVAHAVLGVSACAVACIAVAATGTLRDDRRLVALATTALVVVTTLQAFTVFAPVLEGAWLFLLLGLVLVGTGLVFDRARRHVTAAL